MTDRYHKTKLYEHWCDLSAKEREKLPCKPIISRSLIVVANGDAVKPFNC